MKYIKEYNSFNDYEPIDDSDLEGYYESVIDPPKNIENIILNSEDLKGLYTKIEYHPEVSFDIFRCFQILLEYDEYKPYTKLSNDKKRKYYQIHLNAFYISDEYFICAIQLFRSYDKPDFDFEYYNYYVYKCDSIEGLIGLIKDLKDLL